MADSVFPPVLNSKVKASGMTAYDLKNAKKLFSDEVKKLDGKKFPSTMLYYYDDGVSKNIVTDIVGHWQNNLGAFVNIEAVSSPSVLHSQIIDQTYSMSIFPISADSPEMEEYLEKFGIQYKGQKLSDIQVNLLKSNNVIPLMFQSTSVAYSKRLSEVNFEHCNGCIDFAFIVKSDD